MDDVNRFRYLTDPVFHHAIDLLTRTAVDAVEYADREWQQTAGLTQREVRLKAVRDTLIEHSI